MTTPDLERLFPATTSISVEQRAAAAMFADQFRELARIVVRAICSGREQALALTRLQDAYLAVSLGLTVSPADAAHLELAVDYANVLSVRIAEHQVASLLQLGDADVKALRDAAAILDNGDEGSEISGRLLVIARKLAP